MKGRSRADNRTGKTGGEPGGAVTPSTRHRRLYVLSGSATWCRTTADRLLAEKGYRQPLWVTTRPPEHSPAIPAEKLLRRLGSELDALVFDTWTGFDPDAFGAAAGMIRGGGVMLLLTPALTEWPDHADPALQRFTTWPLDYRDIHSRFLQRLVQIINATDLIQRIGPADALPELPSPPPPLLFEQDVICRTTDQQRAVDAICHVVHGHRRRPLVLTADRGRGKSSALGIAAARLLQQGANRILVTAPGLDAAAAIFQQADRLLPEADSSHGTVQWKDRQICFVAPDQLVRQPQAADLLLVDEAAAIPAPLLETLLRQHARIVFATTIHGYEGTGRGFSIRFRSTLDRLTPDWNALQLSRPIRWAEDDPLEQFTFRALLLNTSPAANDTMVGINPEHCELVQLERDYLRDNESLLTELFGLLVLAHYRTRPGDLRNLLDGPALSIHALLYQGHIAATALVVEEGGLDAALANEVWLGRRRVHGHLLAQSLAVHAGFPEAAQQRYARIMRLAVHPAAQRRGLGTRLVTELIRRKADEGIDALGASFGATPELLDFWHRAGFHTVRPGLRREASSGCHALFMLHPLSPQGATLHQRLQNRLQEQLPTLLTDPLRDLAPEITWRLLQNLPPPTATLTRQEWRDILSFAFGRRGYQVCMTSIRKLVIAALSDQSLSTALDETDRELLIRCVLQNQAWKTLANRFLFQGRKQGSTALRRAVKRLTELHAAHHPAGLDIQKLLGP